MALSIEEWVERCIADARERGDLVFCMDKPWPDELTQPRVHRKVWERLVLKFPDCRGISTDRASFEEWEGNHWFDDRWLRTLAEQVQEFRDLEEISISWASISDAGLVDFLDQALTIDEKWKVSLQKLRHLRLNDAKEVTDEGIQALCKVAHVLPELRFLDLCGTLTALPPEVLKDCDAQAIFQFVRESLAADAQLLGEIKLVVLGQAEAGKTGLVKRFVRDDETYFNAAEKRTHGVKRYEVGLPWPAELDYGPPELKIHVWDFGGQNELHSTHRFFLGSQRCFYLLVLRADRPADGESPDSNRLSYWLRTIAHYGGRQEGDHDHRAPVLIAVTQCDRIELNREAKESYDRLIDALGEAERKKWYGANVVAGPIVGLGWSKSVETLPASKRREIEEANEAGHFRLESAIRWNVARVAGISTKYPANFFSVKEWIERTFSKSEFEGDGGGVMYVDFRKDRAFEKLCAQNHIEPSQLEPYLHILNSLGVVHWVGRDEDVKHDTDALLKQRVFNPRWVCQPVYELIRSSPFSTYGIVMHDKLEQLLPIRKRGKAEAKSFYRQLPFSEEHRDNILGLMKACRLAYAKTPLGGLLIPDLLRQVNPNESERQTPPFDTAQAVSLEAEFLPEKVFLRLLADWYELIQRPNKECFRNEVQLGIEITGQKTPVLVRPFYSPPNGNRPFLQVVVGHEDAQIRHGAIVLLDGKIRDIYRAEHLSGWIGAKSVLVEQPSQATPRPTGRRLPMDPRTERISEHLQEIDHLLDGWGYSSSDPALRAEKQAQILFWLKNFNPSEIDDAMLVLSKIQLKTNQAVQHAIKNLAKELSSLLAGRVLGARFFQLGTSPSDSGGMYLYEYRRELGLGKEHFPAESFLDAADGASALVFFDDVIGTGTQATKFYEQHLASLNKPLLYVAVFGFDRGLATVQESTGFEHVLAGVKLSDEERAFTNSSCVFPDAATRKRIQRLAEYWGNRLYPKGPLGYDDSQALLVFPHNTPNNTLPIIWAGPSNEKTPSEIWNPVWERRKLIEK